MSLLRVPSTYSAVDVVLLEAVTNLHVGVGRAGGVVDLPVQRDELGFPCIYSSSLKGALKTALLYAFTKKLMDSGKGSYEDARKAVMAVLGPEPELGESFESSVAILDAYLLAMPVRSLKGVYAYVTTPTLLKRFKERLDLAVELAKEDSSESTPQGDPLGRLPQAVNEVLSDAKELKDAECVCIDSEECTCDRLTVERIGKIVLVEEVMVNPKGKQSSSGSALSSGDCDNLTKLLALDKPLIVLSDDVGRYVIERSLLRLTRVRLRRETKTVEQGGLWTEEYVPQRTLFHTLFLYKRPPLSANFISSLVRKESRGEEKKVSEVTDSDYIEALKNLRILSSVQEDKVKKALSSGDVVGSSRTIANALRKLLRDDIICNVLKSYVVVGGHESIGKGIIKFKAITGCKA